MKIQPLYFLPCSGILVSMGGWAKGKDRDNVAQRPVLCCAEQERLWCAQRHQAVASSLLSYPISELGIIIITSFTGGQCGLMS